MTEQLILGEKTFLNFIKNIHKYTYSGIRNFMNIVIEDYFGIQAIIDLDISEPCVFKRLIFVAYLLKKKDHLIIDTTFLGVMIHKIDFNDCRELYMISEIFNLHNYILINNCGKTIRIPVNIGELKKISTYNWNKINKFTLEQFKYLQEYIYTNTVSLFNLEELENLREFALEIKYVNFLTELDRTISRL